MIYSLYAWKVSSKLFLGGGRPLLVVENLRVSEMDITVHWVVNQWGDSHLYLVQGLGKEKINARDDSSLCGRQIIQNFGFWKIILLPWRFMADRTALKQKMVFAILLRFHSTSNTWYPNLPQVEWILACFIAMHGHLSSQSYFGMNNPKLNGF